MRRLARLCLSLCLALPLAAQSAPPAGAAQDAPPSLVADRIFINADQTLTAEGAVEVLYRGSHLTARRISYDQTTNRLKIDGPITLTDASGSVILADEADLSADMRDGILTSARMVLNDQLQLASQQMLRVNGRYTQLSRVTASSCQVCASNPRPLWEIRASRVIHDQQEHQLYYDNAQFRVAGLPVLYFPRLRMPDATVTRATGFLLPSLRSSSGLGLGVKLPYFIAIGDSRDLTVTPYISANDGRSVALRYREALANGTLEWSGALSHDRILRGRTRGYFFADGSFGLPAGYLAGFRVETVSDDAYLVDYGLPDKDRLSSGAWIGRVRGDTFFDARVLRYNSLRAGDSNQVQPTLVGDLSWVHRFSPQVIGGEAALSFALDDFSRRSSVPFDANGDGVTDGRDVARASLALTWRRQEILPNGMVLGAGAALNASVYSVSQDLSFPGTLTRVIPAVSVDLAWPFLRPAERPGGAAQMLEPMIQLVWSHVPSRPVPNEDSAQVEFDEGNLFAYSRFPGVDVYEDGLRANIGLTWSRIAPAGTNWRVAAGRILRSRDLGQFSTGSSLAGTRSDWLLATQVATANGRLVATNRALFDDAFAFSRDELRLSFAADRYDLAASYVWLVADPAAGRPLATSELALDGGWQVSEGWRVNGSGRYDFQAKQPTRAALGFEYRNECAIVDLSLSRRYTSSTTVRPTTEFSLSVRLAGFGGSQGGSYRQTCGR
ncbi:MAG: LPS-assembly protein LptD [Proteobacteria bacterium]|nr:LPS-assembly protein LptD [Pseudomonadota bacterium]MBS0572407.1 LPS-assembly protein LptD [Pseudomonadota bacterium]